MSDFRPHAELRVATPGYFCAIGLSMVAGRGFTQRDVLDAPLVALINEEAARRLWPQENPVGRPVEHRPHRRRRGVARDRRRGCFS